MIKRVTKSSLSKKTTTEVHTEKDMCDQIWDEISDKEINMFSLADQTVSSYFTPVVVEPTKLYLSTKVGSAIPALQEVLGSKYNVELHTKYVVVSVNDNVTAKATPVVVTVK